MSAQVVTAKPAKTHLLGLDGFAPGSQMALAVSGGGDSIAMLHEVAYWAREKEVSLTVLTVDHRLRAESADEAAFVGKVCDSLNLPHEILVWDTPTPSQQTARFARHKLLANGARARGATHLLLGHTLDDVIETRAMRAARGTNVTKNVGPMPVSVSPVWPDGRGLLLLRPLLLRRRQDLRDRLTANQHAWIDDPSNESNAYERPRIRNHLKTTLAHTPAEALQALQRRARAEALLAPLLRQCAERCDGFGLIQISTRIEQTLIEDLMPILIPAASGTDRIPKAYARMNAMADILDPETSRYTLGGAWLQRRGSDILIGREPSKHDLAYVDGVFDGRFERSNTQTLPDGDVPFLVRHAIPDGQNWQSLIPRRLTLNAAAFEKNMQLLTRPRASTQS